MADFDVSKEGGTEKWQYQRNGFHVLVEIKGVRKCGSCLHPLFPVVQNAANLKPRIKYA
jgi:hypothetical protein